MSVHYGISLLGEREREREREKRERDSKPAREFLHLPHIFRHYLYMHAQPSYVGLEPSRAAKFCSASSSPTMLLSYLCVRVAETVKTERR